MKTELIITVLRKLLLKLLIRARVSLFCFFRKIPIFKNILKFTRANNSRRKKESSETSISRQILIGPMLFSIEWGKVGYRWLYTGRFRQLISLETILRNRYLLNIHTSSRCGDNILRRLTLKSDVFKCTLMNNKV